MENNIKDYTKPNFPGRRFVMGDIHGGFRGLKQCLERSSFDYENDLLIQLGDVCDGWSETKECLDELMKIKNLILLKGNHDDWAIQHYTGNLPNKMSSNFRVWFSQGGEATLKSLGEQIDKKYLDFLQSAINYVQLGKDMFVHGSVPQGDLDKSPGYMFFWDREIVDVAFNRKGYFKETNEPIDNRFGKIYVGHTCVQAIMYEFEHLCLPYNISNLVLMDTGAAFNGKISMMNIDAVEVFQSDFLMDLYSDEKGRNRLSKKVNTKNK
jgi:serine/threonine protein phosphatase 1